MRGLLMLLVALVLALVLGLLWGSLSGVPGPAGLDERVTALGVDAALDSKLDLAAAPASNSSGAQVMPEHDEALGSQRADGAAPEVPADALWVTGRLLLPFGLPGDERAVVLAKGKSASPKGKAVQRFDVGRDGRFRVAFGRGTRRGRLSLEARYLYLKSVVINPSSRVRELVLEPELGGVLRGSVRLPVGVASTLQDLEGTWVELKSSQGERDSSRFTRLDGAGAFEFRQLPPSESYRVHVDPTRFPLAKSGGLSVLAGKLTQCELDLTRGAFVSGVVLDQGGAPAPQATVSLSGSRTIRIDSRRPQKDQWFGETWKTTTDSAGAFEFVGIDPCMAVLQVRTEQSLETVLELGELVDGERRVDLRLKVIRGETIAGAVMWADGLPAGGVMVHAKQVREPGQDIFSPDAFTATTDEAGGFRLTGLQEGRWAVWASTIGEADDPGGKVRVSRGLAHKGLSTSSVAVVTGTLDLHLVLSQGHKIQGSVRYRSGAALQRFRVVARPILDLPGGIRRITKTFHVTDGQFELSGLQAGRWRIAIKSQRCVDPGSQVIEVPFGERLEFTVERGARLSGRVIRPSGEPLAGAKVELFRGRGRAQKKDTTDRQGRFAFARLQAGTYRVGARAKSWAPAAKRTVTLASNEHSEDLVLVMVSACEVRGRVLPGAGEVARRVVTVRGGSPRTEVRATSDSDGAFELMELGPGRYTATLDKQVRSAEGPGALDDARLAAANCAPLEFELVAGGSAYLEFGKGLRQPIRLHGTVTSGALPVQDWLIKVLDESTRRQAAARTDEQGRYSLTVDGPGEYVVMFEDESLWQTETHLTTRLVVREAREQRADFELGCARLALALTGPDGAPLGGAYASIEVLAGPARGSIGRRWAGRDGRLEFTHMKAGTYLLRAWGRRSDEHPTGHHLQPEEVTIEAAARVELTLELELGASVYGTASYSDGLPAVGLPVLVLDADGQRVSRSQLTTDYGGNFRVSSLPGGQLTLRVGASERSVQLTRGGETHVELLLPREAD